MTKSVKTSDRLLLLPNNSATMSFRRLLQLVIATISEELDEEKLPRLPAELVCSVARMATEMFVLVTHFDDSSPSVNEL